MIKEIIDQWEANKHKLEKWFRENELKEYDSYLKRFYSKNRIKCSKYV